MNHSKSKTFAALLALLLVPALASADSTHISTGPVTNWSYGWKTTPTGSFTPLTVRFTSASGTPFWTDGSQSGPSVGFNNSNTTATSSSGSYHLPRNQLQLHPDNSGKKAVVRWTAEAAGKYQIQGLFNGVDSYGYRDVYIVVNSSASGTSVTLFNQILSGSAVSTFSLNSTLASGDTVDFVVGDGGNGYYFDATGLSALITEL